MATTEIRKRVRDRSWLEKARRLKGRTQGEVAEVAGCSEVFYNRIEKGLQLPNVELAVRIIRLASGRWKSHKEDTVDWNDQKYAEIWRQGWADTANRYLEAIGSPERLDLRSYARQGIDKIPTVHMGPAVSQLEKKGIQTDQHRKPEPGHQYTHCPMDMLFLNSCLPSPLLLYGMHPIHTGSHGLYV